MGQLVSSQVAGRAGRFFCILGGLSLRVGQGPHLQSWGGREEMAQPPARHRAGIDGGTVIAMQSQRGVCSLKTVSGSEAGTG